MMDRKTSTEAPGAEPDYRFTLANERTFLAWVRTALAFVAGGVAASQFARHTAALTVLSVICFCLAALLATGAYRHWHQTQRAIRCDEPLPAAPLIPVLAFALVCLCGLGLWAGFAT